MKRILLCVFSVFCCLVSLAQELPKIIPPSPNTASLEKYGEIPIGLFTGSPQVNIPLYQFSTKNLSVPITLRYSSNGIRVDEYSSNVGMGWDLNAGGSITRRINDDPDELQQERIPNVNTHLYTTEMRDFLNYKTRGTSNGLPTSIDTQPDEYSFNFNGYSGKFYLDDNSTQIDQRNAVFFEPTPLKVEAIGTTGPYGVLSSFKITDPNGIIYTFSAKEKSMSHSPCTAYSGSPMSYKIINSWFLTEIKHPTGDIINLIYETKNIVYGNGASHNLTLQTGFSYECASKEENRFCLNVSTTESQYLKEINSLNYGKVLFTYSQKTDMPINMDKLDKIAVYDKDNNLLKEQIFDYQSYSSLGSGASILDPIDISTYHSKRFFLKKVYEKSHSGVIKPAHEFFYNNPEQLPTRFSASQDYWGYYNGKINSTLISSKSSEFLNLVMKNKIISSNITLANREPDFLFGNIGILKEVKYPTGGNSKLYYESHSISESRRNYPNITNTLLECTSTSTTSASDSFTIPSVPFPQKAKIKFFFNIDDLLTENNGGLGGGSTTPLTFSANIFDSTTNQNSTIYERKNGLDLERGTTPFLVTTDNVNKDYFVKLQSGHSYQVTISVNRPNTNIKAEFDHYATNAPFIDTNVEIGGSRISKVETNDNNGNTQTKKYHYSELQDLTKSSGTLITRISGPLIKENVFFNNGGTCGIGTLVSNSAFPVYGAYHIGYGSVVEENGLDFELGGIETVFNMDPPRFLSTNEIGEYIKGTPLNNLIGYGRQLEKAIFKKVNNNYITLSKSEDVYKYDDNLFREHKIYYTREFYIIELSGGYASTTTNEVNRYQVTSSSFITQWYYKEKTINTQYFNNGLDSLKTTTNYFYDNLDHLQPTRTEVTNSNGDVIKTETKYAHDINDQILISEHRIAEPVEVLKYKNDTLLSHQKTTYNNMRNPSSFYLPLAIQTSKGTQSLEDRIVYHSYDDKGNPTEVSKKDGTHIVYVWGYNQTQPIAKIENATITELNSAISSLASDYNTLIKIQTVSNSDNDRTIDTYDSQGNRVFVGFEGDLRKALNSLRDASALSKAQVTTFTYDPLIGVTSITDPRGQTIYYEYDSFNRLKQVKDKEGNILSENEYNYKN